MASDPPAVVARLAAEIRRDVEDIARLVAHAIEGRRRLADAESDTFVLFGVGKVLHDFYAGTERLMSRVAAHFGGLPGEHGAWHRQLLDDMTLDIPRVRPALLARESARRLDDFLRFRHRFRSLYAFDIEVAPVAALLDKVPTTWVEVEADIARFLAFLDALADPAP